MKMVVTALGTLILTLFIIGMLLITLGENSSIEPNPTHARALGCGAVDFDQDGDIDILSMNNVGYVFLNEYTDGVLDSIHSRPIAKLPLDLVTGGIAAAREKDGVLYIYGFNSLRVMTRFVFDSVAVKK